MPVSEKIYQFDFEDIQKSVVVNAAISKGKWLEVLSSAEDRDLKTIMYTGEEDVNDLKSDNIKYSPPASSTGKLLAFLFQRFTHFEGDAHRGVAVVSTIANGDGGSLEAIILELAHLNNLPPEFLDWIENSNTFL